MKMHQNKEIFLRLLMSILADIFYFTYLFIDVFATVIYIIFIFKLNTCSASWHILIALIA